ncbi:MAG: signal peptidase I [Candidatus Harrisonbacteria bacterium RIFCSPLOWO2_02_FULL_41_13b]|uniref:Signal peptidase I n=1 Tax=Candidatus Harrisonbacteria bacterium RIFCSPLOWO2_02_FULL_41_13b TaxID=1798409 RepID=A0A1G1ZQP7_9BACT|nr:MAG: signal peptidase I [Candidatus Harrisonbacteria bacterium RIFCSPHIGHO2_02_FULL_40_20]OGY66841.1 MAG: signal peptidase I [Candidatus Harrisonbacteria bacterium RIFCSPLOWO2_02_FULL_41_13b]
MKNFWLAAREIIEVVVIALVTVFIIRSFLVQPFLVNGASMEPNFEDGNYLLVDEISYRFAAPRRGEVVVFRYPNDRSVFFIKRLVGLPGERLVIRDGKIYIEGKELSEEYLGPTPHTEGKISVNLGKDEYFVLGDNRSYSFDSRNWGPIQREDIIGVARIRVFPFNAMNVFSYE